MPYDAKFDSFTIAVNVIYNASHTHQKTKKTKQNNNNNNKKTKTKKTNPPKKTKKQRKQLQKIILFSYITPSSHFSRNLYQLWPSFCWKITGLVDISYIFNSEND